MTTHTEGNWRVKEDLGHFNVYKDDKYVCQLINKSNADFIVSAVNSHAELLEACKEALDYFREELNDPIEWAECLDNDKTIPYKLNKAIAKAERG